MMNQLFKSPLIPFFIRRCSVVIAALFFSLYPCTITAISLTNASVVTTINNKYNTENPIKIPIFQDINMFTLKISCTSVNDENCFATFDTLPLTVSINNKTLDNIQVYLKSSDNTIFQFKYASNSWLASGNTLITSEGSYNFYINFADEDYRYATASITLDEKRVPTTPLDAIEILGFDAITFTPKSTPIVFPNQTNIFMGTLNVQVSGNIKAKKDESSKPPIKITLKRNSDVTHAQVKSASLYFRDAISGNDLKQLSTESFGDSDTLSLEFYPYQFSNSNEVLFKVFSNDSSTVTSQNFFIYYAIDDKPVSSATDQVHLYLDTIEMPYDYGNEGQQIAYIDNDISLKHVFTNDSVSARLGGVKLTQITAFSHTGTTPLYDKFVTAPILKFSLQAINTDVTINTISIDNASAPGGKVENALFFDTDGSNRGIINTTIHQRADLTEYFSESDKLDITPATDQNFSTFSGVDIGIQNNNHHHFFVSYEFGDIPNLTTSVAVARLGKIEFSVVRDNKTISAAINESESASASPDAKISFTDTNLIIHDITDISPEKSFPGQIKVPMLSIELTSEEAITTALKINNNANTFNSISNGITKVWVYKDIGDDSFSPTSDQLIMAQVVDPGNASQITIPNIQLDSGKTTLYIAYDIGILMNTNQNAKASIPLDAFQSSDSELIIAGELDKPYPPATTLISANVIQVVSVISSITDISDSTLTQSATIKLTSSENIAIKSITPIFYHQTIHGNDISPEFSIQADTQNVSQLKTDSEHEFKFEFRHINAISDGAGCMDFFIHLLYSNQSIIFQRYPHLIKTNTPILRPFTQPECTRFPIHKTQQFHSDFMFPNHVAKIQYRRADIQNSFFNHMSLMPSDILYISLFNNGAYIDESSISLSLNDQPHPYEYENGVIKILSLGNTSGTLRLNMQDQGQADLPETTIQFMITDSTLLISRPLFYPNPYSIQGDLSLGFNLNTVPGAATSVMVYIMNSNGTLVHKYTDERVFATGYHTIVFSKESDFLLPGFYLINVVTRDNLGNESVATTKLGIH